MLHSGTKVLKRFRAFVVYFKRTQSGLTHGEGAFVAPIASLESFTHSFTESVISDNSLNLHLSKRTST